MTFLLGLDGIGFITCIFFHLLMQCQGLQSHAQGSSIQRKRPTSTSICFLESRLKDSQEATCLQKGELESCIILYNLATSNVLGLFGPVLVESWTEVVPMSWGSRVLHHSIETGWQLKQGFCPNITQIQLMGCHPVLDHMINPLPLCYAIPLEFRISSFRPFLLQLDETTWQ